MKGRASLLGGALILGYASLRSVPVISDGWDWCVVGGWVGFVNIHHDYHQLMNIEVCVHVIMGTIKNECHL